MPAPRQGPCRKHPRGRSQARARQGFHRQYHAVANPPAGQAPACRRRAPSPTHHVLTWWHVDLLGGSTTAPPQLPSCLHGAACIAGQGACRSEEERRRTGRASPLSHNKAKGHLSLALNALCPVMASDKLSHDTSMPPPGATVAIPLPIKGDPRRPGAGFGPLDKLRSL